MDFNLHIRDNLKLLPDAVATTATSTRDLSSIFSPSGHEKALDPSNEIVVGDRGVGKSFWASVLTNDTTKTAISKIYTNINLDNTIIKLGYSESEAATEQHPSQRLISSLLNKNEKSKTYANSMIRSIILNAFAQSHQPIGWNNKSWSEKVEFIENNIETEQDLFNKYNRYLQENQKNIVIVFDAMDRLGEDWDDIIKMSRSILETALSMRSYSSIRLKIFLRPDMYAHKLLWTFRDGSKLKQNAVHLEWRNVDLYGYLWHYFMSDHEKSNVFKSVLSGSYDGDIEHEISNNSIFTLPKPIIEDDKIQKDIFEKIVGSKMGAGSNKGHPYTWIYNHLSDAHKKVSLRTFIIAIRDAARETKSDSKYALSPNAIKVGVKKSSSIRLSQLSEDYPWIQDIIVALSGLKTPNDKQNFIDKWSENKTLDAIYSKQNREMPIEFKDNVDKKGKKSKDEEKNDYEILFQELTKIGVIETRKDGRINIPDIYRLAAKMSRRGGIEART